MRDDVLLVYGINGQELPPQHGFPLRLVVPGWYGMANVKWLQAITVLEHDFDGYQQRSYSLRQTAGEAGQRIDRMRPRALMVPPGIPEVLTRERYVVAGVTRLEGRAWSGTAPIARVDVTTDGGATWAPAELGPQPDQYAWVRWTAVWDASPGRHRLGCRAVDAAGRVQPLQSAWNLEGFACNGVHFISVTVSDNDPAADASVGDR
jgi:DMSO/TMAO reductase YedYZ molybdopterin-dependent catalytic subunit